MPLKKTIIASALGTLLKKLCKPFLVVCLLLLGLHFSLAGNRWEAIAEGIDYYDVGLDHFKPWSHIHAFRVNLKSNQFALSSAKELHQDFASVAQLGQLNHARLAINGGFFDKDYHPLGLRISHHKTLNPFKSISWWGVFYIQGQEAHLASAQDFPRSKNIDFAIQSGPRLLVDGHIPRLRGEQAERSALGITPQGQIIILVTEHHPLSTKELGELMKNPPLNCQYALNLDGGSSSQIYAQTAHFHLNVHGFSNVSDAVIVLPRK